jgi:hypothetical protein
MSKFPYSPKIVIRKKLCEIGVTLFGGMIRKKIRDIGIVLFGGMWKHFINVI